MVWVGTGGLGYLLAGDVGGLLKEVGEDAAWDFGRELGLKGALWLEELGLGVLVDVG